MRTIIRTFLALLLVAGLAGTALAAGLTPDNPLSVDKDKGVVTILAKVNGKYFYQPTRHCVIWEGGKFGDKPVFQSFVTPEQFYNALMAIGAKPGENMTLQNMETTHVQGDKLDVTVTWDGAPKAYTLDEVIKDTNKTPIDIRFGGNLATAKDKNTGCLICLDSCPVGITSNAAYTYGAVEKRKEVEFYGNKDVLPADGTLVTIQLKVKK